MRGCIVAEGALLAVQPIGDGVQNAVAFTAFAVTFLASWGLWRLIGGRSGRRALRIDSAASLAIALGLQYGLLALLVIGMGGPFEAHVNDVVITYHLARGGTIGWLPALVATFALYPTLGVLVILGLQAIRDGRGRRMPSAGGRRTEGSSTTAMGLTQLFVLGFIALISVYLVVVCASAVSQYAVYALEGASSALLGNPQSLRYETLVALSRTLAENAGVVLIAWIVCTIACRIEETNRTRPLESLAAAARSFTGALKRYRDASTADEREAERSALTAPIELVSAHPDAEITQLAADLGEMRAKIVVYVDDLATITAQQERSDAELEMASAIQQSAVTHDFGPIEAAYGIEVASLLTPAREVGGDFYDVFAIDAARVGFVIGDVSGKGLPAALFMMRALAILRESMKTTSDIGAAITLANERLADGNDAMLFVTAFAGVLDRTAGVLAFVNAGHNPPYIVDGGDGEVRALRTKPTLVLGMLEGKRYATETMAFAAGARLVLYTDGVTEATNRADELFGDERLAGALAETCGAGGAGDAGGSGGAGDAGDAGDAGPRGLLEAVRASVEEFVGDAPQADDLTLLVIERTDGAKVGDAS